MSVMLYKNFTKRGCNLSNKTIGLTMTKTKGLNTMSTQLTISDELKLELVSFSDSVLNRLSQQGEYLGTGFDMWEAYNDDWDVNFCTYENNTLTVSAYPTSKDEHGTITTSTSNWIRISSFRVNQVLVPTFVKGE